MLCSRQVDIFSAKKNRRRKCHFATTQALPGQMVCLGALQTPNGMKALSYKSEVLWPLVLVFRVL
jgi:hypothetical protein